MPIFISDADVKRLLSYEECIESMRSVFKEFSEGDAVNRPRVRYTCRHSDPNKRYFANIHVGAMPSVGMACVRGGSLITGAPNACSDRRIFESRKTFNWGIVTLYSTETAEPLAFVNEFELQRMRVGATSALGVDLMAREGASRIGLFGTGNQAGSALEAVLEVRPVRDVVVYSPNAEHLTAFVKNSSRPGITIRAAHHPREVVEGADVVLCCTSSSKPVFDGAWLEDGQMVVTIANSDVTVKRSEVDRRVFERASTIIVNDWETVLSDDQTELLEPIAAGVVAREAVFELGDLVAGKAAIPPPPEGKRDGIVYFKNNAGLAIQLVGAGAVVYRKLMAEGPTREIPIEWVRTDLSGRLLADKTSER